MLRNMPAALMLALSLGAATPDVKVEDLDTFPPLCVCDSACRFADNHLDHLKARRVIETHRREALDHHIECQRQRLMAWQALATAQRLRGDDPPEPWRIDNIRFNLNWLRLVIGEESYRLRVMPPVCDPEIFEDVTDCPPRPDPPAPPVMEPLPD